MAQKKLPTPYPVTESNTKRRTNNIVLYNAQDIVDMPFEYTLLSRDQRFSYCVSCAVDVLFSVSESTFYNKQIESLIVINR